MGKLDQMPGGTEVQNKYNRSYGNKSELSTLYLQGSNTNDVILSVVNNLELSDPYYSLFRR